MNFLQLVQRTRRETGISGSGPTSVVGQSGEMLRLVDWVRDAYLDIQNAQSLWRWLQKTAAINLTALGQTYHPVANWDVYPLKYDRDTFCLYATALGPSDGQFLSFDDYDQVAKRTYRVPQTARPTAFTEKPTREIQFNAVLDQDYTLSFDYYATAEELAADDDVPSLPEQYQLAIVWKAVCYYADYEEVPYLRQVATLKFSQIFEQMLHTEIPEIQSAAPLA